MAKKPGRKRRAASGTRRAAPKQIASTRRAAPKQAAPKQIANNVRRFIGRHVGMVNRRINRNQAAVLAELGTDATVLGQYVALGTQLSQVGTPE